MAEDIICLLDYLGWTADRELNIIGISLGGMIAQGSVNFLTSVPVRFYERANKIFIELAYRISNRISSLFLAVTTPGGHIWGNFPPVRVFLSRLFLGSQA
jgi:hypothetical protein